MEIAGVLSQLKEERDRLDTAIRALEGVGTNGVRVEQGRKRRRSMSAEARAKIAAAARRRWAKARKEGRATLAA